MCCVTFFVKYILFAVNLVFVLAGITLLTIGIVVLTNITDILDLIPVRVDLIPIAVIVIGATIFVIAFCGCCGSINESRCLLVLYAVILIVLAGLSTGLAVVLFRSISNLRGLVGGWLNDAFERQTENNGPFQVLEVSFRCCGTTGAEAYEGRGLPLPPSCCLDRSSLPDTTPDTIPEITECTIDNSFDGCSDKLGNYFEAFTRPISYGVIVIIIIQILAIIASLYLNSTITSKRNKQYV